MSFLDAETWGGKQWCVFLAVVIFALGAAFAGGLIVREGRVQELSTRLETSDAGRNAQERGRIEQEQKDWDIRKAEEQKRLDGIRDQLDADRKEYAKQLDLGRQNEQRIEENIKRVREESETWMFFAKVLLFVALPLVLIVGFFALHQWNRKLRNELREDAAAAREELKQQREQQGQFVENAQRTHLAVMITDRLKENPEALGRALDAMFTSRPKIGPTPPMPPAIDSPSEAPASAGA